jgi:hypothetical protein
MSNKLVYLFSEGRGDMRNLLGGKGANLAEMTVLGLPVPQGFTITTEACNAYYDDGAKISEELKTQVFEYVEKLEEITGKKFGSLENPLLVLKSNPELIIFICFLLWNLIATLIQMATFGSSLAFTTKLYPAGVQEGLFTFFVFRSPA